MCKATSVRRQGGSRLPSRVVINGTIPFLTRRTSPLRHGPRGRGDRRSQRAPASFVTCAMGTHRARLAWAIEGRGRTDVHVQRLPCSEVLQRGSSEECLEESLFWRKIWFDTVISTRQCRHKHTSSIVTKQPRVERRTLGAGDASKRAAAGKHACSHFWRLDPCFRARAARLRAPRAVGTLHAAQPHDAARAVRAPHALFNPWLLRNNQERLV